MPNIASKTKSFFLKLSCPRILPSIGIQWLMVSNGLVGNPNGVTQTAFGTYMEIMEFFRVWTRDASTNISFYSQLNHLVNLGCLPLGSDPNPQLFHGAGQIGPEQGPQLLDQSQVGIQHFCARHLCFQPEDARNSSHGVREKFTGCNHWEYVMRTWKNTSVDILDHSVTMESDTCNHIVVFWMHLIFMVDHCQLLKQNECSIEWGRLKIVGFQPPFLANLQKICSEGILELNPAFFFKPPFKSISFPHHCEQIWNMPSRNHPLLAILSHGSLHQRYGVMCPGVSTVATPRAQSE